MTLLRLLAVLDVLSSTPARGKRLVPRPDGPLTHFASPRGEKGRLAPLEKKLPFRAPLRRAGSENGRTIMKQETLPATFTLLKETKYIVRCNED